MSDIVELTTGVPQGSTLGPLLFLLYMNDIVKPSNLFKFILFADDTNMSLSEHNVVSLMRTMNSELISVATWLTANRLSLNVSKTNYLTFSGNKRLNQDVDINIAGEVINRSLTVKYLGVMIDQNINCKNHIASLHNKISRSLCILHKVKHLLPSDTLLILYNTFIYPYLYYCNVAWGMANITTLKPLQLLQNRVIRIIGKVKYDVPTALL